MKLTSWNVNILTRSNHNTQNIVLLWKKRVAHVTFKLLPRCPPYQYCQQQEFIPKYETPILTLKIFTYLFKNPKPNILEQNQSAMHFETLGFLALFLTINT